MRAVGVKIVQREAMRAILVDGYDDFKIPFEIKEV